MTKMAMAAITMTTAMVIITAMAMMNALCRIAIVVQGRSSALKKLKADFPFTW